jgi:hypothetical protein
MSSSPTRHYCGQARSINSEIATAATTSADSPSAQRGPWFPASSSPGATGRRTNIGFTCQLRRLSLETRERSGGSALREKKRSPVLERHRRNEFAGPGHDRSTKGRPRRSRPVAALGVERTRALRGRRIGPSRAHDARMRGGSGDRLARSAAIFSCAKGAPIGGSTKGRPCRGRPVMGCARGKAPRGLLRLPRH